MVERHLSFLDKQISVCLLNRQSLVTPAPHEAALGVKAMMTSKTKVS